MFKVELFFVLCAVNALHIVHEQTTERYNATNYLADLQQRQSKFVSDISLIRSQIDSINATLNSSTLTPQQQLRLVS
jgi:hypothetical protein